MASLSWLDAFRIMGPAFLVSVALVDPGNWATAIEAGSRFGYELVWVVVASNLIAILLQTLAARLGIVTGKHLAQVCRESYPPPVCALLWVLCEISIVALDLTMLLGTAIGLNLLLGWPLLPCIVMTSLDALLLLLLVPAQGVKTSEGLTVGLLGVVVVCFLVDLVVSRPPIHAVVGGLMPRLRRDSVYTAVSLLGANVMPHNFYLHSALVINSGAQQHGARGSPAAARHSVRALCLYNFLDIGAALGVALVINVAVLLVSAATFHTAGVVVHTLQDAHDLMEQTLSSSIAPAAFGTALLCAGQLSTFTGTIAGQVVLQGFLNIHISTWLRRLITRTAAIIPAAVLQYVYGDRGTYKFLLIAQVVLALQLPVTLVPLIKATSSRALMGPHASSRLLAGAAWCCAGLVFVANLGLFVTQLLPQVSSGRGLLDKDGPLDLWLDHMADMAFRDPLRLAGLLLLLLAASAFLALQLWMIVTPLRVGEDAAAAQQQQQEREPKGSDALSGYDPCGSTDDVAAKVYGRSTAGGFGGNGKVAAGAGARQEAHQQGAGDGAGGGRGGGDGGSWWSAGGPLFQHRPWVIPSPADYGQVYDLYGTFEMPFSPRSWADSWTGGPRSPWSMGGSGAGGYTISPVVAATAAAAAAAARGAARPTPTVPALPAPAEVKALTDMPWWVGEHPPGTFALPDAPPRPRLLRLSSDGDDSDGSSCDERGARVRASGRQPLPLPWSPQPQGAGSEGTWTPMASPPRGTGSDAAAAVAAGAGTALSGRGLASSGSGGWLQQWESLSAAGSDAGDDIRGTTTAAAAQQSSSPAGSVTGMGTAAVHTPVATEGPGTASHQSLPMPPSPGSTSSASLHGAASAAAAADAQDPTSCAAPEHGDAGADTAAAHANAAAPDGRASRPAHPVTRGTRKQAALLLEEFWSTFYNSHGQAVCGGQGQAHGQHADAGGRKEGAAGAGGKGGARGPGPGGYGDADGGDLGSPLICSHTDGSHLCMGCSQQLFGAVQRCILALEQLGGVAAAMWGHWPLELLPQEGQQQAGQTGDAGEAGQVQALASLGPAGHTFLYHRSIVIAARNADFPRLQALCQGTYDSSVDRSKLLAATPIAMANARGGQGPAAAPLVEDPALAAAHSSSWGGPRTATSTSGAASRGLVHRGPVAAAVHGDDGASEPPRTHPQLPAKRTWWGGTAASQPPASSEVTSAAAAASRLEAGWLLGAGQGQGPGPPGAAHDVGTPSEPHAQFTRQKLHHHHHDKAHSELLIPLLDPTLTPTLTSSNSSNIAVSSATGRPAASTAPPASAPTAPPTGSQSAIATTGGTGAATPTMSAWCVLGPASLISFGVWCAFTLMQWCSVETRPELWGRYAAVLNRLQGVLWDAKLDRGASPQPSSQGGQEGSAAATSTAQQHHHHAHHPARHHRHTRQQQHQHIHHQQPPLSQQPQQQQQQQQASQHGQQQQGSGLSPLPSTALHLSAQAVGRLREALLLQLALLEARLGERRGPAETAAGEVAFPKGKEIIASVARRYRRKLGGGGGGGGASGGGGGAQQRHQGAFAHASSAHASGAIPGAGDGASGGAAVPGGGGGAGGGGGRSGMLRAAVVPGLMSIALLGCMALVAGPGQEPGAAVV